MRWIKYPECNGGRLLVKDGKIVICLTCKGKGHLEPETVKVEQPSPFVSTTEW